MIIEWTIAIIVSVIVVSIIYFISYRLSLKKLQRRYDPSKDYGRKETRGEQGINTRGTATDSEQSSNSRLLSNTTTFYNRESPEKVGSSVRRNFINRFRSK